MKAEQDAATLAEPAAMPSVLTGISSMATRSLLAELAVSCPLPGVELQFESTGGVDAARRVMAGESFDLVVLAADAMDRLAAADRLVAGSLQPLVHSPVAIAVRAGAARPDIGSAEALRGAVLQARRIGYSTGPSGVALMALFDRWGLAAALAGRLLQAPAGVPVGALIADGSVDLGFQQLSELLNLEGIEVLGMLPSGLEIVTTFSGAVGAGSTRQHAARQVLAFMASEATAVAKRRHGMVPA